MSKLPPPLPNRVAEMLALADAVAIFVPSRYRSWKTGHDYTEPYWLVQMRPGVPPRGSVAVESHGGWTYKSFADALHELLTT